MSGIFETGKGCGCQVGGCTEDEGAQSQIVEHFAAIPPDVCAAIFPDTLVVETIDGRDLPRFVIASNERDPVRIANLQAKKQQERLERIEAAVDEIAHEEVICVRYVAAHAEELHQVMELTVNVTADGDWGVDGDHIAFFDEQFSCFVAKLSHLGFGDRSARAQLRYGSAGFLSVAVVQGGGLAERTCQDRS
jgi:hypothetical protein